MQDEVSDERVAGLAASELEGFANWAIMWSELRSLATEVKRYRERLCIVRPATATISNSNREKELMADQTSDERVEIQRNSQAWHAAWAGLATEIRNRGLGDGSDLAQVWMDSEAWQFMGAWNVRGDVTAEFRHRNHPVSDLREYVTVTIDATATRTAVDADEWF